MNSTHLFQDIALTVLSQRISAWFINGPRGAGKSFFGYSILKNISNHVPGAFVVGPINWDAEKPNAMNERILQDLVDSAFLEPDLAFESPSHLCEIWTKIARQGNMPRRVVFVTIIDVGRIANDDLGSMAQLFSSVRTLDAELESENIRLAHIIIGSWDHQALVKYYQDTKVSFPYTSGANYIIWTGIEPSEMYELASSGPVSINKIQARALHELTGGNPAVAAALLERLDNQECSLQSMLDAARSIAHESKITELLLDEWKSSTGQLRPQIQRLIQAGVLSFDSLSFDSGSLLVSLGIAKRDAHDEGVYYRLASWYVELVLRFKGAELGLESEDDDQVSERIPTITSINHHAYRIINEVENLLRNAVVEQLLDSRNNDSSILTGWGEKYDQNGELTDAYQRAEYWKSMSKFKESLQTVNPEISYLSMRDLAQIIMEIGAMHSRNNWQNVGHGMRQLADIRDAVMHNQILPDDKLAWLIEYRAEIIDLLRRRP